jgi:pimeloyl-ACP methyl ester carboxylesterase
MTRPRILLCPQFTELEWVIAPQVGEWAGVAPFDSPGVGGQPMPGGDIRELTREVIATRGLEVIDERGWTQFFVVGDALGTATAVRLARRRPEAVLGIVLGHASLNYEPGGDRPAINAEVHAAMGQLLRSDYESFVRYGITQMTQGTFDEEVAQRMVERLPPMEIAAAVWDAINDLDEPMGEMLRKLDKPLLIAKHEGCIAHTPEGFEDAVAAFPEARSLVCERGPSSDPRFADEMRRFCEQVLAGAGTGRR